MEEEQKDRGSSNDAKRIEKASIGSKFSSAVTKPTISKMSSTSHPLAFLSEDVEGEALDLFKTALDKPGSQTNRQRLSSGRKEVLEKYCHDLLDQMYIFEKIRESRHESIKGSPLKKLEVETPSAKAQSMERPLEARGKGKALNIQQKFPSNGEDFESRAAMSAMQSYRRQSTV